MLPVLSKKQFLKRFLANEFGNRTRVWSTVEEWEEQLSGKDIDKLFHLRNKQMGGHTYYGLDHHILKMVYAEVGNKDDYYVAEMADPNLTVIQGEVQRSTSGLYLHYSRAKKPMREALAGEDARHVWMGTAYMILTHYLSPEEHEEIRGLLDRYDDHAIEFSKYSKPLGVQNKHLIIWEVRNY